VGVDVRRSKPTERRIEMRAIARITPVVVGILMGLTTACGGGEERDRDAPTAAARAGQNEGPEEIASIPVGREPGQLVAGFGSLWVATPRRVVRIDPRTNTVVTKLRTPDGFLAIGEGSVWVSGFESDAVHRFDPVTNKIVATIPVGDGLAAMAFTPGAGWIANHDGGSVSRVDPRTNTVVATVRLVGRGSRGPRALAADPRGVWVAVPALSSVVRIDAATNRVTERVALPQNVPPCGGLAVDERGVWVSAGICDVGVAKIDRATNAVTDVLLDDERRTYGVYVGNPTLGGTSLWLTKSTPKSGSLYEIDPASGKTISRTRLRPGLSDSTFAFGSLWLADSERGRIIRLQAD
jgi:virginiamycin B lyase